GLTRPAHGRAPRRDHRRRASSATDLDHRSTCTRPAPQRALHERSSTRSRHRATRKRRRARRRRRVLALDLVSLVEEDSLAQVPRRSEPQRRRTSTATGHLPHPLPRHFSPAHRLGTSSTPPPSLPVEPCTVRRPRIRPRRRRPAPAPAAGPVHLDFGLPARRPHALDRRAPRAVHLEQLRQAPAPELSSPRVGRRRSAVEPVRLARELAWPRRLGQRRRRPLARVARDAPRARARPDGHGLRPQRRRRLDPGQARQHHEPAHGAGARPRLPVRRTEHAPRPDRRARAAECTAAPRAVARAHRDPPPSRPPPPVPVRPDAPLLASRPAPRPVRGDPRRVTEPQVEHLVGHRLQRRPVVGRQHRLDRDEQHDVGRRVLLLGPAHGRRPPPDPLARVARPEHALDPGRLGGRHLAPLSRLRVDRRGRPRRAASPALAARAARGRRRRRSAARARGRPGAGVRLPGAPPGRRRRARGRRGRARHRARRRAGRQRVGAEPGDDARRRDGAQGRGRRRRGGCGGLGGGGAGQGHRDEGALSEGGRASLERDAHLDHPPHSCRRGDGLDCRRALHRDRRDPSLFPDALPQLISRARRAPVPSRLLALAPAKVVERLARDPRHRPTSTTLAPVRRRERGHACARPPPDAAVRHRLRPLPLLARPAPPRALDAQLGLGAFVGPRGAPARRAPQDAVDRRRPVDAPRAPAREPRPDGRPGAVDGRPQAVRRDGAQGPPRRAPRRRDERVRQGPDDVPRRVGHGRPARARRQQRLAVGRQCGVGVGRGQVVEGERRRRRTVRLGLRDGHVVARRDGVVERRPAVRRGHHGRGPLEPRHHRRRRRDAAAAPRLAPHAAEHGPDAHGQAAAARRAPDALEPARPPAAPGAAGPVVAAARVAVGHHPFREPDALQGDQGARPGHAVNVQEPEHPRGPRRAQACGPSSRHHGHLDGPQASRRRPVARAHRHVADLARHPVLDASPVARPHERARLRLWAQRAREQQERLGRRQLVAGQAAHAPRVPPRGHQRQHELGRPAFAARPHRRHRGLVLFDRQRGAQGHDAERGHGRPEPRRPLGHLLPAAASWLSRLGRQAAPPEHGRARAAGDLEPRRVGRRDRAGDERAARVAAGPRLAHEHGDAARDRPRLVRLGPPRRVERLGSERERRVRGRHVTAGLERGAAARDAGAHARLVHHGRQVASDGRRRLARGAPAGDGRLLEPARRGQLAPAAGHAVGTVGLDPSQHERLERHVGHGHGDPVVALGVAASVERRPEPAPFAAAQPGERLGVARPDTLVDAARHAGCGGVCRGGGKGARGVVEAGHAQAAHPGEHGRRPAEEPQAVQQEGHVACGTAHQCAHRRGQPHQPDDPVDVHEEEGHQLQGRQGRRAGGPDVEEGQLSPRPHGYPAPRQGRHRGDARNPRARAAEQHRDVHHDADLRHGVAHVEREQRQPVQCPGLAAPQHARHHRRPHRLVAPGRPSERPRRRLQRLPHQARLARLARVQARRVGLDGLPVGLQPQGRRGLGHVIEPVEHPWLDAEPAHVARQQVQGQRRVHRERHLARRQHLAAPAHRAADLARQLAERPPSRARLDRRLALGLARGVAAYRRRQGRRAAHRERRRRAPQQPVVHAHVAHARVDGGDQSADPGPAQRACDTCSRRWRRRQGDAGRRRATARGPHQGAGDRLDERARPVGAASSRPDAALAVRRHGACRPAAGRRGRREPEAHPGWTWARQQRELRPGHVRLGPYVGRIVAGRLDASRPEAPDQGPSPFRLAPPFPLSPHFLFLPLLLSRLSASVRTPSVSLVDSPHVAPPHTRTGTLSLSIPLARSPRTRSRNPAHFSH
ncbi:uncharacterized protein RHOBADRAFT_51324, partial [Rhodotorula graminis WP1]